MSWQTDSAGLLYSDLTKLGNSPTQYHQGLDALLSQYASNAGVQYGTQPQGGQIAPQAAAPLPGNNAAPLPGQGGDYNAQHDQFHQQPQQSGATGPYQLTQPQQGLLNQRLDIINKQQQGDIAQLTNDLASKGITDPRALNAATQQLQEHYASLGQQTQATFYEDIRKQKEDALAALIRTTAGLQQEGTSGLLQAGQIHEAGARQDASFGYQVLGDLLGGIGGIAGLATGVPGVGTPPIATPQYDYAGLLSRYGVGGNELFTNPDRNLAGEGQF